MKTKNYPATVTLWANRFIALVLAVLLFTLPSLLELYCKVRVLRPEEKVAVIPGSAFGPGGEGFVRACYASSMKDLAEAIARLDNFLINLRRKQGREG